MVRVGTDEGIAGWGEAFGHNADAGTHAMLAEAIGPCFLGRDCAEVPASMSQAERAFRNIGRTGPAACALSGIDIALWDLAAQAAGQPLFRLLGGPDGRRATRVGHVTLPDEPGLCFRPADEALDRHTVAHARLG